MKTTIKQVVESFTKEEKAEMFREANLKSLPDTFLTAHTCESFTDVADQITQGIEEFDDFKKGLVDLGDMLMEQ